jgi:hypothetical protein
MRHTWLSLSSIFGLVLVIKGMVGLVTGSLTIGKNGRIVIAEGILAYILSAAVFISGVIIAVICVKKIIDIYRNSSFHIDYR